MFDNENHTHTTGYKFVKTVGGKYYSRLTTTANLNVVIRGGERGCFMWEQPILLLALVGRHMEETNEMLQKTLATVKESKRELEGLANDVKALSDIVQPLLSDQIKKLRASRMAVVSEVKSALSAMRDVRSFFMESDYNHEMERLERFIGLCAELDALKRSGVLDAVADTSIRLADKELSNGRK
jgi:hypothetical protein